ncbi:MAG: DUF4342 domain-containing protein [Firmicutes bacterium]|nr:DUF4342 domain-containing protein [Bacillota bacterium]
MSDTNNTGNTEEIPVEGEHLLAKIKEIIKEGNARKITIKNKEGKEIISFPATVGVVGVVLAPVFAAVGAIAVMTKECTVVVER